MKKQILFTKQALKFLNGLLDDVRSEFYANFALLMENGRLETPLQEIRKALQIKRSIGL